MGGRSGAVVPPTGRQFELRRGAARAVVTEVGATLRCLEVAGQAFLDGFGPGELPGGGNGQVLIPFPNRIGGGRYRFGDQFGVDDQQLPVEEPATGNAMHGLVRWANWQPLSHTGSRLVMGLTLHARKGYPFVLSLRIAYTLLPDGLRVRQTARNLGAAAAPYGAGFHPYLSIGSASIDDDVLRVPAASSGRRRWPAPRSTSASRAGSARRSWTPATPTCCATGTASPASSWPPLIRVRVRPGAPA